MTVKHPPWTPETARDAGRKGGATRAAQVLALRNAGALRCPAGGSLTLRELETRATRQLDKLMDKVELAIRGLDSSRAQDHRALASTLLGVIADVRKAQAESPGEDQDSYEVRMARAYRDAGRSLPPKLAALVRGSDPPLRGSPIEDGTVREGQSASEHETQSEPSLNPTEGTTGSNGLDKV